jgi:Putative addiction module component
MAQPLQIPPPGFDDLDDGEKLDYIDRLYRHLGPKPIGGIHDWQKALLDERIEAHEKDPSAARPWRESIANVRAELQKLRG